jgi:tRNA-Thr(GGU) m(6)t(6)A37 methyltransferase TsaA
MSDENIIYKPIGIIYTPYQRIQDMPIQPSGASQVRGKLVINPKYSAGLTDLDGFSHVYLIYHFHQVTDYEMVVTPFLDKNPHGVFATRAPKRPNPIGLSIVKLVSIEENVLILDNVDMLDGTPILDIKPYVPAFDQQNQVRVGWLAGRDDDVKAERSDERFA